MTELIGIENLRKKLKNHKIRVDERYSEYNSHYGVDNRSILIPLRLKYLYQSTIGWIPKAVNTLADRLIFKEFRNDVFNMGEIFNQNNPDTLFDSAILSALIGSCSFIYIAPGEKGEIPRLQVIEGSSATGVIDPITGLLKEGYAVLETDEKGNATLEAYFKPYGIDYYVKGEYSYSIKNKVSYPLLVPVVHRPDATRPFGRSKITRGAVYWKNYARRTLERSEVTSEFYSFPQKYVLGLDPDAEEINGWKATISSMLRFDKDSDGDTPKLGQFTTSSMQPFIDQLRMAAAGFAGETGLTLDDLGFVSDNPSSVEAIKAGHEQLILQAKKAQRDFGRAFINTGYLAVCVRDDEDYKRSAFYDVKAIWNNLFDLDLSSLSLVGDAIIKINQAIPGAIDEQGFKDLAGL